jgi:hypothetical protein
MDVLEITDGGSVLIELLPDECGLFAEIMEVAIANDPFGHSREPEMLHAYSLRALFAVLQSIQDHEVMGIGDKWKFMTRHMLEQERKKNGRT